MLSLPVSHPAESYGEALSRARAFMALDDASIRPDAHTVLLDHSGRTHVVVVLLHGFTNHPGQYAQFAPLVFERGANVFVPRLPEHGDRDRMTTRLRNLTAEELLASATEAVDIACGLGDRVCVLGLSTSGLLCAYFGQYRSDVALSVPVSPVFALTKLSYGTSHALVALLRFMPNMFLWWDPRVRERQRPATAYPRYPTHALAQCLRIGDDVYQESRVKPALAGAIATIVNRTDPAVNNDVTAQVVRNWQALRRDGITYTEFHDLPENHDIVDPNNPQARVAIVYPRLLEALGLPAT